jgi:hypothetical protein
LRQANLYRGASSETLGRIRNGVAEVGVKSHHSGDARENCAVGCNLGGGHELLWERTEEEEEKRELKKRHASR